MDEPGFTSLPDARVAIVGLGLMGGSLALALRGRCREIVGVDSDPAALALACAHGVIDRASDFESALDCQLLVLAAPVRVILAQLALLSRQTTDDRPPSSVHRRPSLVVLDLGSTKTEIVSAMQTLPDRFDPVGGHPMCGKELAGIVNAEADLYRGKVFVLTPLARTSPAGLALARELIEAIGSIPLVVSAERHDALAAVSSHLPYVAAVTLMRVAQSLDDEQVWKLAASGFRDTSRLAASDLTMMADILLTNRAAILEALSRFRVEFDSLTARIDAGDPEALRAVLAPAQSLRAELFTSPHPHTPSPLPSGEAKGSGVEERSS